MPVRAVSRARSSMSVANSCSWISLLGSLGEEHAQRVGFLAARTGDGPDPQGLVLGFGLLLEQRRDDVALQRFEGLPVAEEIGHADQHVCQQRGGFLRPGVQESGIGGHVVQRVDLQATFDAPQDCGLLVMPEIMAGPVAQQFEDLA